MVTSPARTVSAYLASLPPERRRVMQTVRGAVNKAMPAGYKEVMMMGLIAWVVPLSVLPETYNGHPLMYAALAAQKHYYALYVMCASGSKTLLEELRTGYAKAGLRFDMGKSCLRFRDLDGIALDVVTPVIARVPMDAYVHIYHASRRKRHPK